jgi:hypothetical protein
MMERGKRIREFAWVSEMGQDGVKKVEAKMTEPIQSSIAAHFGQVKDRRCFGVTICCWR